jgi:pyruvate formate lyase activating enzyme
LGWPNRLDLEVSFMATVTAQDPRTVTGRIHSTESCGAVDGPGLRFVIFTQGCKLRCKYCHNPDTWDPRQGTERTVADLMAEIRRYQPFMKASGGGITLSGGEPLLQPEFVAALFAECRRAGIHTCLDTTGYCLPELADPALDQTDLVMLDIKHAVPAKHKRLTGVEQAPVLAMAQHIARRRIRLWIRYVLVPGWTDDPADVEWLCDLLDDLGPGAVEKVQVLPYHLMGRYKWEALGIRYQLEGVEPPSKELVARVKGQIGARGYRVE